MYKDSIYNKMLEAGEDIKNSGFDYNNNGMVDKFFAKRMYQNPRMSTFLNYLNDILINFTESVKKLQFYNNYTIDKNDRRLNI